MWGWDKDIILSLLVSTFPLTYLSGYYKERGVVLGQKTKSYHHPTKNPNFFCNMELFFSVQLGHLKLSGYGLLSTQGVLSEPVSELLDRFSK